MWAEILGGMGNLNLLTAAFYGLFARKESILIRTGQENEWFFTFGGEKSLSLQG